MTETSRFFHPPLKKYKPKYLFSIKAWANEALKWSAANRLGWNGACFRLW